MNKPKLLITGATGLLGPALIDSFSKKYRILGIYSKNALKTNIPDCKFTKADITNKQTLTAVFNDFKPDLVIHAACLTNLELCEKNPKLAEKVNVTGTKNVIKACKAVNSSKLVFFSTDYIFDGTKGNYSEQDTPNPKTVYAKTKVAGEKIIAESGLNFLIVRTSIHGWNFQDKKSFSEWLIHSMKSSQKINLTINQFSSVMLANDLAKILFELVAKRASGIYNVASHNKASRTDFALELAEVFDLDKNLIKPVTYQELLNLVSFKSERPIEASLDVSKIEHFLNKKMPSILDGIRNMKKIENIYKRKFYLG